jgi:carbamoyltransferase
LIGGGHAGERSGDFAEGLDASEGDIGGGQLARGDGAAGAVRDVPFGDGVGDRLLARRAEDEARDPPAAAPAAGDAGGAVGAAYLGWHLWLDNPRQVNSQPDAMKGSFLGPRFHEFDIRDVIRKYNAGSEQFHDFRQLAGTVAKDIAGGKVVGWFQGRMEYGPRALGNRSILGDARNPEMQKKMNLKIKYREGFRPFAPAVLEEDIQEYFEMEKTSPYMLMVIPVKKDRQHELPDGYQGMELYDRLYHVRSDIPAVTHIDFSARIQSVHKDTNPRFWELINEFKNETGYGIIINTSFNVRGEPIVCTPEEAFKCFMRTEMDSLVLGNFYFRKEEQTKLKNDSNWKEEFKLD